jgi:ring-1,2-phenylacetyl-CoA epoxidase subunit PaaD
VRIVRSALRDRPDPADPNVRDDVLAALRGVDDPEYPGVSIVELGLVEDVRVLGDGRVEVDLVPTFSGCPALAFIADDVTRAVGGLDAVADVAVTFVSSPAWTPARIAPSARERIGADFGVAVQIGPVLPACPNCGVRALVEESLFGPVRCRSVDRCRACGEVVETIR